MDTPEKTKITTPLSKFEDSPVFNYINSLSPIKPVKSIHITQTFQSLSFSSLPSIFTSPHVTSHKESRFLRRHNNSDPSKPEFSSGNGNKVTDHEGALEIARFYGNSSELRESFDPRASVGEASVVPPPSKHVHFATELPQNLKYDCGSPESDPTPRCGPQVDCMSELDGISASEICRKSLPEGEANLQEMYQSEQKTEATDSDWENLITDAADLLIFNSPIDSETFKGLMQRSVDPHEVREIQMDPLGSGEDEFEYPSTQPGETVEPNEINRTWESFATSNNACKGMTSNPSEEPENEMEMSREMVVSNLHRGMRRRCLDFEVVGARRKNLSDNSNSSASNGVQSDEMMASKSKQPMPVNPGGDSSRRRVLPGIGLHLNALTITSKDSKNVKIEALSSEISLHSPSASFQSPTIGQELIESLTLASEPEMDPTENGVLLLEDVSQTSACLTTEEFNHNSPKKKRRKLDGEIEGCKRCNCKKSKCLKLYCECFAAGVYCIEPCSCQECFNKPIHEDTVLSTRKQIESRNPLAFAPKVIRGSESVVEIGDDSNNNKTPASARHKRGCNCKKSNCLKKYCECYQGGVGCSINCRCEACKNAFGRKDGSAPPETEAEAEEETEGEENHGAEKASQKIEIQNNEEHNPNAIPVTPLSVSRPLLRLPFSSKGKPPRSFLGIGSSSGLYTNQKYGKPNILRPEQKFEKQLQTVPDDDIPEILRDNYSSPSTGIKTSPNGKRVSPPHSIIRSGRKLILQSIPSFPSLTPHH